ncbi:insulinase family protein [Pedobacter hiemivivus]|uniref:Insulinase family protein n=1 Tax=Pedobacter hiemivivus TaxID=2530454 RepID=A0A4U1GFW2_9SPHI|nr:insulinase family protein [Pedobacter hiemivivus]TKC60202.1 insulinase family protein [Pedobacter hiemivivus]
MRLLRILPIVLLSAFCIYSAGAQTVPAGAKDQLMLDVGVKVGKLPNGFTYYIRKNIEPKNRAIFYLANKIGSIVETEEERGLAHFTEHLSFKGTTHFPKNKMIDYLQSVGVRFGADLNAYTSFDETVYQLPIPTDNPEVVKQGIQIMRDWAGAALIEAQEMEPERGVILEEKRLRKSAEERMREIYWPVLLNHSRYVDRLPIGTEQVIKNASLSMIKNFYQRWYRPDLEALIVVGDFDPAVMEKMIIEKFSDFKAPDQVEKRIQYGVNLDGKNQFIKVTDPEYTSRVLQIMSKHRSDVTRTRNDLRDNLIAGIYNELISSRFSELRKQANPPYLQGGTSIGNFFKGVDVASTVVAAKPNELERGFKAVYTELERVKRHGFIQSELDRVKNETLNYQESVYKERDKTPSVQYVKEYLQHFLNGEISPGKEYLYHFYRDEIMKISLEDINALVAKYYVDANRDIMVLGPESEKASLPEESTILKWIAEVKNTEVSAYSDNLVDLPLLQEVPKEGKIVKETKIKGLDITELVLGNGIKVVLKPTNFKNDQVLFYAFSPGGNSLYPDHDYQSAVNATTLVASSGLGPFDAKQLPKMLSGKLLNISPYLSERYEGFKGSTAPKDFETTMQLLYLYFTAPKADEAIFNGLVANYKSSLLNRENIPGLVFSDTANAVLGSYHPRRTGPSLAKANQISFKKAYEIYKERFADASDFTFIFTGNFTDSTIRPLLKRYIASLPSIKRKESWKDVGVRTPKGIIRKDVYKGTEDKATVQLVLSGDYNYGVQQNIAMDALQEVLDFRLLERLRKKESGVYTPDISVSYAKYPIPEFRVGISFGCAPEKVNSLIAAAEEEIKILVKEGITMDELAKFKAEQKLAMETQLKTNAFWNSYLVDVYREHKDPTMLFNYDKLLIDLKPIDVQNVAKRYLSLENYIAFVLYPEIKTSK